MKCPQCSNDNPPDSLFCGACGAPLDASTLHEFGGSSAELPMVGFSTAVKLGFSNYFMFGGRSTRAEYWWWVLFSSLGSFVLSILGAFNGLPLQFIFILVTLIPGLAVGARRLHDINKSGWWQLLFLAFVLIIPVLIVLWWSIKHSDIGSNKHGPDSRVISL